MSAVDSLVADYLSRLETAAAGLPPDRRTELLEEIGEHISSAQPADEAAARTLLDRLGAPEDIVAVAREDLPGPPPAGAGWGPPAVVAAPRGTGHELAAVLMLTAGSFLPVVGWLVGVVLLWTSSLWRVREKVLATLVVPLGPGGVLLLGGLLPLVGGTEVCSSGGTLGTGTGTAPLPAPDPAVPPPVQVSPPPPPGATGGFDEQVTCEVSGFALPDWTGWVLLPVLLLAPVVVGVVLLRRARRRAAAQTRLVPSYGQAPGSSWSGLEIAGVLLLALGSFVVPFVGALVGLGLCCASARWTAGEKLAAAGLVTAPLLVALLGFLPGLALPPLVPGFGIAFVLVPLGGLLGAGYLTLALQRRR